jgi:hypothetical protein
MARGAAFSAGLKVGDRLISVDGTNLENATHEAAVATVKNGIPNRVSGFSPRSCRFGSWVCLGRSIRCHYGERARAHTRVKLMRACV